MKETKSELKVTIAYLVILAAYLLGIDVQQIMLYITDAEAYVKDIRELVTSASDKDLAATIGALVPAVYSIVRTIKKIHQE